LIADEICYILIYDYAAIDIIYTVADGVIMLLLLEIATLRVMLIFAMFHIIAAVYATP